MKHEEMLAKIKKKYPDLIVDHFHVIEHGQNNKIILINKELVFRFPRTAANQLVLKREYNVLSKIREILPLEVPRYDYYSMADEIGSSFAGYPFIQGEILSKKVFDLIDHEALGKQLCSFLQKLHSAEVYTKLALDLEDLDCYKVWDDMFQRIKEKLFPFMPEENRLKVTQDFNKILESLNSSTFVKTVVHGDFGPTNILVDIELEKISGIIDFGSIHLGDPAEDIACMIGPFGYGIDFILEYFQSYNGIHNLLERAVLYTKSFALQEALYGIENDDKRAFDAGMTNYI